MNKFGELKNKMLTKLTESYTKENKTEVKDILKTIKENKDFKEMYLFYEEIESKTIQIIEAISFRKIKTHVTKTKITTKNIKFQNLRFIFLFINKNLQINKRKFLDAQKLTTINLQFFQKFLNNNAK